MPRDIVTTLQDVVLGDIRGMRVTVGPVTTTIGYEVRDQHGEPHHSGTIVSEMPTQLKQDIAAWITADVLPAINAQEGME